MKMFESTPINKEMLAGREKITKPIERLLRSTSASFNMDLRNCPASLYHYESVAVAFHFSFEGYFFWATAQTIQSVM